MCLPLSTSRKGILYRLSFRYRLFFLIFVVAVYSFVLVGCKKSAPSKPSHPPEKVEKAQEEGMAVDKESDSSGKEEPEKGAETADADEKSGESEGEKAPEEEKILKENRKEEDKKSEEKQEDTKGKNLPEGAVGDVEKEGDEPAKEEEEKKVVEKIVPQKEEKPEPPPKPKKRVIKLKPAYLEIVTDFSKASATVNGLAYPSYQPPGTPRGVTLPAGGPYYIVVKYGQNTKSYEVYLRPYERRVIVADLTGFNGVARAPSANRPEPPKEEQRKGKVIVYSQPDAIVYFDGKQVADHTPATIEETVGDHDVSVRYNESLRVSERRPISLRPNATMRLYFRQKKK